jgi:hypothetical protein
VCVTDARCQVKCGKDRKQENLEKEGRRKKNVKEKKLQSECDEM